MGRSDRWDSLGYDSYADSGVRSLYGEGTVFSIIIVSTA